MNRKWIVIGIVGIVLTLIFSAIPLIMYIQLNGVELVLMPAMTWLKTTGVRWIALNVGLIIFIAFFQEYFSSSLVITPTPYTYTVQPVPQIKAQKSDETEK